MLNNKNIVFAIGPAGTGKTYLAVAKAVSCLQKGAIKKIILSRPAVEAGEKLGFLPGDLKEKFDLRMLEVVKQTLLDDKVVNLKIIDIRKKTAFTDFIILGSGTSNRHIINMAKNVREKIKKNFDFSVSIEGIEQSDWVLIDASSLVVNIFKPKIREFYNLEKIWDN